MASEMRQNIELKVRHPDLVAARAAAKALDAEYTWTRTQRDSYFAVTGARLKIREMPGETELIAYWRSDAGSARESNYQIWPIADATHTQRIFQNLWPVACVVEKTRELWMWHNVRIHIDTVKDLGTFVELEGVVTKEVGAGLSRHRVDTVIAALGLDRCEAVPQSYSDLILDAGL